MAFGSITQNAWRAHGAAVILSARRRAVLDIVCGEVLAADGAARALETDVSSVDSVTAAFATLEDGLGIQVNSTGVTTTQRTQDLEGPGTSF